MSLNDLIQTTRPTVSEIVSRFRDDLYYVDNSFQRRLVWTEKEKVKLIETILMGYPIPEIYLWQQPIDTESGIQRHSIIDGQQRITTLTQFVSNEWALQAKYLSTENQTAPYSGVLWKDLDVEQKASIWNYVINIRTVPQVVEERAVRAIFKRLNETDKSLNPQELRNAEFNGQFILASELIADDPRWREWGIFSDGQIRRMADIQLASSMLTYKRKGVVGETPADINAIYDMYNDVYEDKDRDVAEILGFLDRAGEHYFIDPRTRSFFTKPVNFYTLFCVDDFAITRGVAPDALLSGLNRFVAEYENADGGTREENVVIEDYREGASSRTASKASRDRRVNSLLKYLELII